MNFGTFKLTRKHPEELEEPEEEEPCSEEALGKVYYLKTRFAGRRLLGKWLAWREEHTRQQAARGD